MIIEQDVYNTPINVLINTMIREYDISKANINILLYYGKISSKEYNRLLIAPKIEREKEIGLIQRYNKDISETLKKGFVEFRKQLFISNKLKESDILAIRKDAVFVIDKELKDTVFGNVEFKMKNVYSSFYRIKMYQTLEMYFSSTDLEVKGIGDESLKLHKNFMIDYLQYIFYEAETRPIYTVLVELKNFMDAYRNKELSIEYYREFNNFSRYKTLYKVLDQTVYLDSISGKDIDTVDISYNYEFLNKLYQIYLNMYFRTR